ncbi:hypothetical protein V8C86DRAFT_613868 [Haematococcus lacustris]
MAPGTPMQHRVGGGANGSGSGSALEVAAAHRLQIIAAWQGALSYVAPALQDDVVVDVVAARRTRIVLLTNRHIAYLIANQHHQGGGVLGSQGAGTTTYRLKWFVASEQVDNVRGVERSFRISVEYRMPVKVGRLLLKLPLRKGMRTDDAESHQNLIYRLNRHIGKEHGNTLSLQQDIARGPWGCRTAGGWCPPTPTLEMWRLCRGRAPAAWLHTHT